MTRNDELERLCDGILRRNLPDGVAVQIRRLLESGCSPRTVMAMYRRAGTVRGAIAGLAIEAEIEAVAAEIAARKK